MFVEAILKLSRQLYPLGRAFKMPLYSDLEKLHRAIAQSESVLHSDIKSVLDSILPDNDNFTVDDATAWERRLGLITNENVSLADRKLAIQRKMNHPGNIPARQSASFLEFQLRAAGFDVYIYENIFPDGMGGYITKTPGELSGGAGLLLNRYGKFNYGSRRYGGYWGNIIANHIDESKDLLFDIAPNLRSTFFIGGNPIGTFANVDEERKAEFRQLILKVKAAHTVGFLFINYV
jgi:hypothetical protein